MIAIQIYSFIHKLIQYVHHLQFLEAVIASKLC
jgi:hypothetical protein